MSLTLYVAHALLFNFVVNWMGWISPGGLDVALAFAAVYWIVAIAARLACGSGASASARSSGSTAGSAADPRRRGRR